MASKSKEAREGQKDYWENKLNQRLAVLADRGLQPQRIAKDATVRKIRAKIRTSNARLKAVVLLEKKVEELASIKSEKMAAPKKEKTKKQKELEKTPELSKRQQKKKKKVEGKGEAKNSIAPLDSE